jgi:excisionase family DNA binding protein
MKLEVQLALFTGNNLLNVDEVAEILNVSTSTIRVWVLEKKIPFVKFGSGRGGLVKFNPVSLNDWIDCHSVRPGDIEFDSENMIAGIPNLPKLKIASDKTVQQFDVFLERLKTRKRN